MYIGLKKCVQLILCGVIEYSFCGLIKRWCFSKGIRFGWIFNVIDGD